MDNKPNIVEVISAYLPLKRTGKEWCACCPFHEDKTPSFSVNENDGVFYCFGCHVSGDVFDFLMKWSGKSFKEVSEHLGTGTFQHRRIVPDSSEVAARNIYLWVKEFGEEIMASLREIGDRLRLAQEQNWKEEMEILERQWAILEILHEDLFNPDHVLELYENRSDLRCLVNNE